MSNGHGVFEFALLNLIEDPIHRLLTVPLLDGFLGCHRESLGERGRHGQEERKRRELRYGRELALGG